MKGYKLYVNGWPWLGHHKTLCGEAGHGLDVWPVDGRLPTLFLYVAFLVLGFVHLSESMWYSQENVGFVSMKVQVNFIHVFY